LKPGDIVRAPPEVAARENFLAKSVNFSNSLAAAGSRGHLALGSSLASDPFGLAARASMPPAKDPIIPDEAFPLRSISETLVEC